MAAKKTEVQPQDAVPEMKSEPKYVVEKLRSNCVELFGVTSSTFDGAMHGHDLNKEYGIGEVKKILDVFLNGGK